MKNNKKFQTALEEIKDITGIDSILFLQNGECLAATAETSLSLEESARELIVVDADSQIKNGYLWLPVELDGETEYVLAFGSEDPADAKLGRMAVSQIKTIALSLAEGTDRGSFIRNLLLGNMLLVDVYSRAKKLHIEAGARVVYVIDTAAKNNEMVLELVKNLSDLRAGDFVTNVDEHSVVLVKDLASVKESEMDDTLMAIARSLADTIQSEAMIKARVGYGNVVSTLPDLTQSFQEAKMALEVGRVFYAGSDTISYSKLGIGRLIYQLPMSLCEMYIKEVFGDQIPDILEDEEAMTTINVFFENSLNISETARQLYLHRNTLVYRLERIEKAIGLDIRRFDDAMTFRIAVMVIAHMKGNKSA